nr:MAG TPA: hypothetical protein [Caudoviricetes sp.]
MWHIANFVHFVLSLKIVNKIPYLNDYLTLNKNGDTSK